MNRNHFFVRPTRAYFDFYCINISLFQSCNLNSTLHLITANQIQMTNTNYYVPALETLVGEGFSNIQIQENPRNYYEFTIVIDPHSTDSLMFSTYETYEFLSLIEGLIKLGQLNSSWHVISLLDDLRPRVVFPNRRKE